MQIIYQADKNYPNKLKNIYEPPKKLYMLGCEEQIFNMPSIAIIGCRDCSQYGAKVAYQFAYQLAKRGICIISGLARGIDSFAHKGAISSRGKTIAVLGGGFSYIYPKENIELCRQIIKSGGAILTEYDQKVKPEKMNFPARNRIIAGLADSVLVVEAKKKSGTLITVDFALEQGKEVFAIPGDITKENSYGTNNLIKQGAKIVTCIDDILEELVTI